MTEKTGSTAKGVGRLIVWAIAGALFGVFVGVLSRELGYGGLTGSILAGTIAAPTIVMVLLLGSYWRQLIFWTIGGAVIGAVGLVLVSSFAQRAAEPVGLGDVLTSQRMLNGALLGAVVMTWFGAGWSVFRGGLTGVLGLLAAVIAGAFLGPLVWIVGDAIGGRVFSVEIGGHVYAWQLGEMVAGALVGVLVGAIATRYAFTQDTHL